MQNDRMGYLYRPSPEELREIRTIPGRTARGKPFDWLVRKEVQEGKWRLECVGSDVLGLTRPLEIYRASRRTNLIKPWPRSDDAEAYCPAHWADLAIGCGPCGLRCRGCFLILTHRVKCDPSRHLVYENTGDYVKAVTRWLRRPNRRNLGIGIDCSDSLLYEGVTGHVRRLVPLFASPKTNPNVSKCILLTKSVNVRYLEGLPTANVLVTFSLNPGLIADLWEGKFDDRVRVTPSIDRRLQASLRAQAMGFEVRWRIDPIIPVDGWQDAYAEFFSGAARDRHRPTRITLGTYRETQPSLRTFAQSWGLPPIEWTPSGLEKDGAHYHLDKQHRVGIYRSLATHVKGAWSSLGGTPYVALCKEPRAVRTAVGLTHDMCNCG